MNKGRIEQVGTPDEIYDEPATPFVFGFIGETNALPVSVESGTIYLDDRPVGRRRRQGAGRAADAGLPAARRRDRRRHARAASPGIVVSELRHGADRRLAIEIGIARHRIEIDIAAEGGSRKGGRVVINPTRWRLYAASTLNA